MDNVHGSHPESIKLRVGINGCHTKDVIRVVDEDSRISSMSAIHELGGGAAQGRPPSAQG